MSERQDVRIVSAEMPFAVVLGLAFKWVFAVAIAGSVLGAIVGAVYLMVTAGH